MARLVFECDGCGWQTVAKTCPNCGVDVYDTVVEPTTVSQGRPMVKMMIQKMPDIWDETDFMTSRKTVLGELACFAIRQSPYLIPLNLSQALNEFAHSDVWKSWDEYFWTNCKKLQESVFQAFRECPHIEAWNIPRKGKHETVFVSRHGVPQPDYDFVDLDALARNVAAGITLQEKYDGLHD
jgi:hypothetical protein